MPGGVKKKREQQTVYHAAPAVLPVVEFSFCFSSVLLHPTSASDCRYLFVFTAVCKRYSQRS